MVRNGIEYLDEDAEIFPNGSVHDAMLARDSVIQGLPCAGRHSVVFFPSGQLRLAWLARGACVGEVYCAPGIVYLHEKGTILNAALAANLKLAEVTVPSGARVTLDEHGDLVEYNNRLSADRTIGAVPCAAEFDVWFYASGRLSMVVLALPTVIGGQEFPRGTEISFAEDGQGAPTLQQVES